MTLFKLKKNLEFITIPFGAYNIYGLKTPENVLSYESKALFEQISPGLYREQGWNRYFAIPDEHMICCTIYKADCLNRDEKEECIQRYFDNFQSCFDFCVQQNIKSNHLIYFPKLVS